MQLKKNRKNIIYVIIAFCVVLLFGLILVSIMKKPQPVKPAEIQDKRSEAEKILDTISVPTADRKADAPSEVIESISVPAPKEENKKEEVVIPQELIESISAGTPK